jgi:hypothetical protein
MLNNSIILFYSLKQKTMKVLLFITLLLTIFSCKKESGCYDAQLEQQFRNSFCTEDCPGVIGCDGKTYCNECDANRHGIRVD